MADDRGITSIYLYKPPNQGNFTNTWVYYRIISINGPDEQSGKMFAPIQMRKVSWPTFADIPPVTDTPGITGLTSAYEQMCRIAKSQWGVEHEHSTLIGIFVGRR